MGALRRRRPRLAPLAGLAALVALLPAAAARAQDLEPRSFANTPVGLNFLIGGYAYSSGSVATDASLPLEDAKIDVHASVLAYARSFGLLGRSAKIDAILPYAWLDGTASYLGTPVARKVDGLVDPRVRVSWNFYGSPAMPLGEWRQWHQDVIVGGSLQVSIPVGQYDHERLVNLGSNRWFFKPELGVSKAWGKWIAEISASATIFTDNNEFYGEKNREQAPILATQGHLLYTFWRNAWAAFDVTYYGGGRTTVDGVEGRDRQSNVRVGGTITLPLSIHYSLKLYGSTAASTRTGTDFDTVGVALQYRWGEGLDELAGDEPAPAQPAGDAAAR